MLRNLLFGGVWISLTMARVQGADFEVTTTNDAGAGSYRQAIEDSNDNPGLDRIVFNIPGDGVHTIRPLSPFPSFTSPIEVDGYTQPGARPNTLTNSINAVLSIQFDGVNLPEFVDQQGVAGVRLLGGSSTIRGLVINRFTAGLWLASSSNRVVGNFIGTTPSGLSALGNRDAFFVEASCCQSIGGVDPADRNLITGNRDYAFWIADYDPFITLSPVMDSTIQGNFIGVDATGLSRLANVGGARFTVRSAKNFTIGGLEPGAGNIIAPGVIGIHVYARTVNVRILGNSIGVGSDGLSPTGITNSQAGIYGAGGSTLIASNHIAFGFVGVSDSRGTLNGNRIHSNLYAGITGQSAPDFPEFVPLVDDTSMKIDGRFKGRSNAVYRLEFFANHQAHPSGYGEGEVYLGAIITTNSAAGESLFHATLPNPGLLLPWITGAATDSNGVTSSFALSRAFRSATDLQILLQPKGAVGRPGANVTLRVDASGAELIFYQWLRNGIEVPGATNTTLPLLNLQPGQDGVFTVRLSNPFGTLLSDPASVVLLVNPNFVRHPVSQDVAPGEWFTVSAVVNGSTTLPLSFGWRSNGVFIAASGPTYNPATYLTVRAGNSVAVYGVVVSNTLAPNGLGSSSARVTVVADRDKDGLPDLYETAHHLDPDSPADAVGDADGDGVSNSQEYYSGTDPEDSSSYLKIDRVLKTGSDTQLEFGFSSNKTYSVQFRDVWEGAPWATLTNLPAATTSGVIRMLDLVPVEQRFYRLATPRLP